MPGQESLRYWICDEEGLRCQSGDITSLRTSRSNLSSTGFIWWDLAEATSNEMDLLRRLESLGSFAAKDLTQPHSRPKFDVYDHHIVAVMKTVWYIARAASIETGDVTMLVAKDLVVTVRHGEHDPLPPIMERLRAEPRLRSAGAAGAAYALVNSMVDGYLTAADAVQSDINEIERVVFSGGRVDRIAAIYSLKREVVEFRDAVLPLEILAQNLWNKYPSLPGVEDAQVRDTTHLVRRVASEVHTSDGMLDSILNAHLGQITMWQNADMRRISGWAAIIAVPTLVSGIYGMNFEVMPELHSWWGYPMSLSIMAVSCAGLYLGFRRNGWL